MTNLSRGMVEFTDEFAFHTPGPEEHLYAN
jgi:hypothetical protein